ncbi:MAG: tripartite tricarboxylate transporter substrate binding protein [Rhodobacteraceae bacterium]|nr:tripartite tricarboxylate transporter substrate binding protein [Paracoccaceae bacterium]
MRTSAIALIAGLGVALSATAALADYPESPIEVIIPYGAGGNSDTSGRILINAMRDVMGADFVPLNVTGAGGTVGTAQLAGSDPDGYTLGYNPIATVTVQPHLRPVPYNNESFAPVCMIADNPTSVTVAPDSPFESIDDLIAAAKGGENIVAVGGAPGSMTHITQAMIADAYGVGWTYLPAGGGGRAAASIMAGEATFATDTSAMERVHGLKTLAVAGAERVEGLEDVPTLKEQGVDVVSTIWFGLFAPAGTPDAVLDTLSAACEEAVQTDSFIEGMANANYIVRFMGREEFGDFFQAEYVRNRELLPVIGVELPAQ